MSNQKIVSDELRDAIKDIFFEMDTNNDGWLSREELKKGHERLQFKMNDRTAEEIFRIVDANRDGKITLDEFIAFIKCICEMDPMEAKRAELRRIFDALDVDGDGLLTTDELYNGFKKVNSKITKKDVKRMTSNVAKDKKGRIDFEHFVILATS